MLKIRTDCGRLITGRENTKAKKDSWKGIFMPGQSGMKWKWIKMGFIWRWDLRLTRAVRSAYIWNSRDGEGPGGVGGCEDFWITCAQRCWPVFSICSPGKCFCALTVLSWKFENTVKRCVAAGFAEMKIWSGGRYYAWYGHACNRGGNCA